MSVRKWQEREPDPRLRELPRLVARDDQQDPPDRDRVDDVFGDTAHVEVRLEDGAPQGSLALLRFARVQTVEHHRADADHDAQDVNDKANDRESGLSRAAGCKTTPTAARFLSCAARLPAGVATRTNIAWRSAVC